MEHSYWITGTDGQRYGPATRAQLQAWVDEGRVVAETQVNRTDSQEWKPASAYIELVWNQPAYSSTQSTPPMPSGVSDAEVAAHARVMRSGADWFLWIAGLSAVNVIAIMSGSGFGFIIALAATDLISGLGSELGKSSDGIGSAAFGISAVLNLLAIGLFVLFGLFARKGHLWAFIVGLVFYLADSLLCLMGSMWLMLAFHAWATFSIVLGMRSALALRRLARAG